MHRHFAAFELLGGKDVPDDGQRCAIVGWKQWSQLLDIEEFANADYVGKDELPWQGAQAKKWLGTLFMPFSGLTKTVGDMILANVETEGTMKAGILLVNANAGGAVDVADITGVGGTDTD